MAASSENRPRTYGNWHKPKTPGVLGLGSGGMMAAFALMVVSMLLVMLSGLPAGALVFAVGALVLAAVTVRDRDGQSWATRRVIGAGWLMARLTGSHLYRSGPVSGVPHGSNRLPGLLASARLSEHEDSWRRPFALIEWPATRDFTVVLSGQPNGEELVDAEQVDVWVARWGQWLALLAEEAGIEQAVVVVESTADSGTRLRREVHGHHSPAASGFAEDVMSSITRDYPAGSSTVRAYVALTFSARPHPKARPLDRDRFAQMIAPRIPNLTDGDNGLSAAGLGAVRPVTAQRLCEIVRCAYDPAVAPLVDEERQAGTMPDLSFDDVGPVAHQAGWDSYRHDSGVSVTWQMTAAPRGVVQSSVLSRLLSPQDGLRKRVAVLYRPESPARTADIVDADRTAADFRASSKRTPSARDQREQRSAAQTAVEESNGAGLVNFGMLVTLTSTGPMDRSDVAASIDNLAGASRIRLRPVFGAQDAAFAMSLPLGVVPRKHTRVPHEIKEQL